MADTSASEPSSSSPTLSSSSSSTDDSDIFSESSVQSPDQKSGERVGLHGPNTRSKRLRANDRERRRVLLINRAMESLRNAIPGLKEKRKLTKLELLRGAQHYIWLLDQALRTGKTVEELLDIPLEKTVYYLELEFPTLKREMGPMF